MYLKITYALFLKSVHPLNYQSTILSIFIQFAQSAPKGNGITKKESLNFLTKLSFLWIIKVNRGLVNWGP